MNEGSGRIAWRKRREGRSRLSVLFLLSLVALPAQAQTRLVQLVNADSVIVNATEGQTVRTLIGNVVLRQDTTTLRAARAVQYVERGEVVLEGRVRIVTGTDTLRARRVVYDSNTNEAVAEGDVRIANGEALLLAPRARHQRLTAISTFDAGGQLFQEDVTLTAPRGVYDGRREFATVEGGATLEDSTTVLTSDGGTYDARARRADFAGSVRLRRIGLRLDADSLTHFRDTEESYARGRVVLERLGDARSGPGTEREATPDSTQRIVLFGDEADHDERAGTSLVRSRGGREPLLVQLRTDSLGATDTTLVRAQRLRALRRDTLGGTFTQAIGVGGVRLVRDRLAAIADSAATERLDPVGSAADSAAAVSDRLALYGADRPSVWHDGAQVTGDTLIATARDEALQRLDVTGRAFAGSLDSLLGRVRQLAGRRMRALFRDDTLRVLSVWPNAEAIYFRASPDTLLEGAERLSADSLAFVFEGDALREVRGDGGIEGVSYGPQIIPEPFTLPGYRFAPDTRPTRADLLPSDAWESAWLDADAAGVSFDREGIGTPPEDPGASGEPQGVSSEMPFGESPLRLPPSLPLEPEEDS